MSRTGRRACRGGAAMAVTLAMAFVLSLLAAAAHHALLSEQRISANHLHATVALNAAEAGIDWMTARLNGASPDGCAPAGGAAFRARHAGMPGAHGAWSPPGAAATCTARDGQWHCRCGAGDASATDAAVDASPGELPSATFTVGLHGGHPPHLMRLSSAGCVGREDGCTDGVAGTSARADVAIDIGHLPALAQVPAAAVTVRGAFAPASPWDVRNPTPGLGLTVRAGGTVAPRALAAASAAAGRTPSPAVVAADPALRALTAEGLFASLFRMDRSAWRALPTVRRVTCGSPCDAALRQALADGRQQLWLDGGLTLADRGTVGSPAHPVLLVVDGPVRLSAGTVVHGVVYAASPAWTGDAGAQVIGAVIAEHDLTGTGGTAVRHDAAVLTALRDRTGTFVRVPGSWRDF